MQSLSPAQHALVTSLSERLSAISGVRAVVLGGSYARGRARPDSDIDIGLLYSEASPLSIDALRELCQSVNDTPDPVVSGFYEWGPWVNGGSWLTIGGQRVDFLYKNIEQLERVISESQAGHYEQCYSQQAPLGFFSDTYLAEVETAVAWFDPEGLVERLQRRVAVYPEALRSNLIAHGIGSTRFDLYAARQCAASADAYLTSACFVRVVSRLVHMLFALNRRYRVNDKTALLEVEQFELVPPAFRSRVDALFAHVGASPEERGASVERLAGLVREIAELCQGAYAIDGNSPAWLRHIDASIAS
jgi:predicted nucleotidyltransferase